MTTWNDFLIRDSLQDTGIIPSLGNPCTSPDLICTQQNTYAQPTQQFGTAASYGQDPNLPTIVRQNNYYYARAKNLAAQSQGGNVYVYWTKASLILTPTLWFNQPMLASVQGTLQPNNPLPAVGQNGISVTQQPFQWTPADIGPADHYCLIGVVGTSLHPWPPPQAPTFASMDAFVDWVRNNANICWRNVTLVTNPSIPQWDRVDGLYNPWSEERGLLLSAECIHVPVNTQVTLKCTALGVDITQRVTNSTWQVLYAQGVTCPGGFNGAVETIAQLPGGGTWPPGARINTVAYFTSPGSAPMARYAADFGADAAHEHVRGALRLAGDDGVLVKVGDCTTLYTGPAGAVAP